MGPCWTSFAPRISSEGALGCGPGRANSQSSCDARIALISLVNSKSKFLQSGEYWMSLSVLPAPMSLEPHTHQIYPG